MAGGLSYAVAKPSPVGLSIIDLFGSRSVNSFSSGPGTGGTREAQNIWPMPRDPHGMPNILLRIPCPSGRRLESSLKSESGSPGIG